MSFNLMPFPLSLIFIAVFGIVIEAVLWKLRRNGPVYCWLSNLALVACTVLVLLVLYLIFKPII